MCDSENSEEQKRALEFEILGSRIAYPVGGRGMSVGVRLGAGSIHFDSVLGAPRCGRIRSLDGKTALSKRR